MRVASVFGVVREGSLFWLILRACPFYETTHWTPLCVTGTILFGAML